jgi:hypothetical protein
MARKRLATSGPYSDDLSLGAEIVVRDGEIIHAGERYPLAGAHATVDAAGAVEKRVTATRLILTGPFAFGLRKKRDSRELYLLVEGEGFGFVVELDPRKGREAREFAVELNAAASAAPVAGPRMPVWMQGALEELDEALAEGVISADEFESEKAALLARL